MQGQSTGRWECGWVLNTASGQASLPQPLLDPWKMDRSIQSRCRCSRELPGKLEGGQPWEEGSHAPGARSGVEKACVCADGGRRDPLPCPYVSIIHHLSLPGCTRGSGCKPRGPAGRLQARVRNFLTEHVGPGEPGLRKTPPPLPAPLQPPRTRLRSGGEAGRGGVRRPRRPSPWGGELGRRRPEQSVSCSALPLRRCPRPRAASAAPPPTVCK